MGPTRLPTRLPCPASEGSLLRSLSHSCPLVLCCLWRGTCVYKLDTLISVPSVSTSFGCMRRGVYPADSDELVLAAEVAALKLCGWCLGKLSRLLSL